MSRSNNWLSPRAASIFGLAWVAVAAILLRPQAAWWGSSAAKAGAPPELGFAYAAAAAAMAAVPGLLLWQLGKATPAVTIKHHGVTATPVTPVEVAAAHRDLADAASSVLPLILVTGFPGFLASELLPRILQRAPGARALCLVQGKFAAMARARLAELDEEHPNLHLLDQRRVYIAHGDIVSPTLGLQPPATSAAGSGTAGSEPSTRSLLGTAAPSEGRPKASMAQVGDPTKMKSPSDRKRRSASGAQPQAASPSGSGASPSRDTAGRPTPGTNSGGGRDITVMAAIASRVIEIFHVAAVYDLSVSASLADAVNVRGTRNVLDFAKRCPRLHCLHYISTW